MIQLSSYDEPVFVQVDYLYLKVCHFKIIQFNCYLLQINYGKFSKD